jgi:Fe-S cluster assembly iron-binding protein IscA
MIQISDTAQTHFRKLIEREALPGLGVRLSAVDPGDRPHPDSLTSRRSALDRCWARVGLRQRTSR